MTKTALITGITGQDGSYLAEFLLEKGYVVHGIVRRSSSFNTGRIQHIFQDIHEENVRLYLHYGEATDASRLEQVISEAQPDEIYNLAAQSHVKVSFDEPLYTADVVALGALRLMEAIRRVGMEKKIRFYQASSSEMFGKVVETPQNENTPFNPRSPYACAKVYVHYQLRNYREAYGMHASSGILFNHESPRRGGTFVTRKITSALARIVKGETNRLFLGNLDAKRDWGYAKDYVEAMWLMLQQPSGDDYVVATGESRSVREFLDEAFGLVNLDWHDYVMIDHRLLRPTEVDYLRGDPTKARTKLGWKPRTDFKQLVKIMVKHDLEQQDVDASSYGL
jgi:GDPmannose 4,6-dehydratase